MCDPRRRFDGHLRPSTAPEDIPTSAAIAATRNPLSAHPHLVAEWHPTRNGTVTPDHLSAGSSIRAWWLCAEGHVWESMPSCRTTATAGCPRCARIARTVTGKHLSAQWHQEDSHRPAPRAAATVTNRQPTPGTPQVAGTRAIVWHPSLNVNTTALDAIRRDLPVWWLCANGHGWEATPSGRQELPGCPTCEADPGTLIHQ